MKLHQLFSLSFKHFKILNKHILRRLNYASERSYVLSYQRFQKKDNKMIDYEFFVDINKVTKTSSKDTLISLLHLPQEEILKYITMYPDIKKIPPKDLLMKYQLLINYGLKKSVIRKNVHLFADDIELSFDKLKLIKQCGFEINDGILFTKLSLDELKKFMSKCEKQNIKPVEKVEAINKLLQQESLDRIIDKFCEYKFLRSQSLSSLLDKIKLCLDSNITSDYLLMNIYLCAYSLPYLKSKVDSINKLNEINRNKRISINEKKLEKILIFNSKFEKESKKVLAITDYMAEKLACDKLIIEYLFLKHPGLMRKNLQEFNQIIDLCDKYGIKKTKLLTNPRIFFKDIHVLETRLKKMKESGVDVSKMLRLLLLSHTIFSKQFQ